MAGLYGKNSKENRNFLDPIFGSYSSDHPLPKYQLNEKPVEPRITYRIVKDHIWMKETPVKTWQPSVRLIWNQMQRKSWPKQWIKTPLISQNTHGRLN